MGLNRFFALSITFLLSNFLLAQSFLGNYVEIDRIEGNKVELTTTEATLQIEFCTPSIIRPSEMEKGRFSTKNMVSFKFPKIIWPSRLFSEK